VGAEAILRLIRLVQFLTVDRLGEQGLLPWCPAALESVRKGVELFDSILKKLVE
jgi:hypothetical protein